MHTLRTPYAHLISSLPYYHTIAPYYHYLSAQNSWISHRSSSWFSNFISP
jgi:hypothetical protein